MSNHPKKILIVSPSYSENNGGAIALHKLCDILNLLGREAHLFPYIDNYELNKFNYKKIFLKFFSKQLREPLRQFKTNPNFRTSYLKKIPHEGLDNWIVIYPEIIFGNPLDAKNVVRWLLHNPGFHSGKIFFGKNEFLIRFGSWFEEFHYPGSTLSKSFLHVVHYPTDIYNLQGVAIQRTGTAYSIRKSKNKKIIHNLSDSILIDGKKHGEIAEIFKRVKTFISYDPHSTFSVLAAMCGCDSVVIPDEGISESEWMPDINRTFGIAYGFENISKAAKTRYLLQQRIDSLNSHILDSTASFLNEVDQFFS